MSETRRKHSGAGGDASAGYPLTFLLVDEDGLPVTGATPTVTLSKNGAAFAAAAGAVSEIGNGIYALAEDADDMDTIGVLLLHATAAGAVDIVREFAVVLFNPFDEPRYDRWEALDGIVSISNVTDRMDSLLEEETPGNEDYRFTAQALEQAPVAPAPLFLDTPVYLGDYQAGETLNFKFVTRGILDNPSIVIYEEGGTQELQDDITVTPQFDNRASITHVQVDLSSYTSGRDYQIVLVGGEVDSEAVSNIVLAHFSLEKRNGGSVGDLLESEVPGSYDEGTAGFALGQIDGIKTKTDTIGSLSVEVTSPVAQSGEITLFAGDAYTENHTRTVDVPVTGGPDLTDAEVKLLIGEPKFGKLRLSVEGEVLNPGEETQTCRFQYSSDETDDLERTGNGAYIYQIRASWPADDPVEPATFAEGKVNVKKQIPEE